MNLILENLGFTNKQTYEKWRETFVLGSTTFCLDTMPYGNFLEIEGTGTDIMEIAGRLGLDWKKRILLGYLGLFEIIKNRLDLSFSDVTFKNFESVTLDITKYLHLFEAGQKR